MSSLLSSSLLANLDVSTVLVCCTVFAIVSWLIQKRLKTKNLPPGPTNMLFVGCIPALLIKRKTVPDLFEELSKEYGPLCMLPAPFGQKALIISGSEVLREALSKPEFNCSPKFPTLEADYGDILKGKGK